MNITKTAFLRKLLKGLGNEIEFKYFFNFTTFQAVKVKTYGRNSRYWSSLPNYLPALLVIPLVG
jgi:hypothetical protein